MNQAGVQNHMLQKAFAIYRKSGFRGLARRSARKLLAEPQPAQINDYYIGLLSSVNAGWLDPGNVVAFDHALANLPSDAPIIEIGSFCGLSANLITYLKEKHGRTNRLITCDWWAGHYEGNMGASSTTRQQYGDFVKQSFINSTAAFSSNDLPWGFDMLSDEFFAAWHGKESRQDVRGRELQLGGPISLAYIDGSHAYDVTRRDFDNTDRHMVSGGFILMDDTGDECPWESRLVAQEVVTDSRYELISKSPNYFFRKK